MKLKIFYVFFKHRLGRVKPATDPPYVLAFSLSSTVPAFHRASVYVRLSAFCLRFYAAKKVRPVCVYVFENNACVRK